MAPSSTSRRVQPTGFADLTSKGEMVDIPRSFLVDTLPTLRDLAEIQVCLAIFRLVDDAGTLATPIAERVILRDRSLRDALRVDGSPREPNRRILQGLELAVGRGTLLRFTATSGRRQQNWYYVNTPENRATAEAMADGSEPLPELIADGDAPTTITIDRPNVFRLYEQNIGPLTPLLADQLMRALERYPEDWITDAMEEAVAYNRRSWRYIQRILEHWTVNGRGGSEREPRPGRNTS